jgi:hypothetical protein
MHRGEEPVPELRLRKNHCSPRKLEEVCILLLVRMREVRERHENSRFPKNTELRDGPSSSTAHDEICESKEMGKLLVLERAHEVACVLGEILVLPTTCEVDDITEFEESLQGFLDCHVEDLCPLTPPEDEEYGAPTRETRDPSSSITGTVEESSTDRVAGDGDGEGTVEDHPALLKILLGESETEIPRETEEESIRAPEETIRLMEHDGDPEEPGDKPHGRRDIPPLAEDDLWLEGEEDPEGFRARKEELKGKEKKERQTGSTGGMDASKWETTSLQGAPLIASRRTDEECPGSRPFPQSLPDCKGGEEVTERSATAEEDTKHGG